MPTHTRSEATGFVRPQDSGMLQKYSAVQLVKTQAMTRVAAISSDGRVGAIMHHRRVQCSSHITESAVKNELSINFVIMQNLRIIINVM